MAARSKADWSTVRRARSTWLLPTAAGLALVGCLGWLWLDDPHDGMAGLPDCPIKALTGWQCPGCGGLRATWHLMHGDLAGAWADNPAIFVMLPILGTGFALWASAKARGLPPPRLSRTAGILLAILGVGWMLGRNVLLST